MRAADFILRKSFARELGKRQDAGREESAFFLLLKCNSIFLFHVSILVSQGVYFLCKLYLFTRVYNRQSAQSVGEDIRREKSQRERVRVGENWITFMAFLDTLAWSIGRLVFAQSTIHWQKCGLTATNLRLACFFEKCQSMGSFHLFLDQEKLDAQKNALSELNALILDRKKYIFIRSYFAYDLTFIELSCNKFISMRTKKCYSMFDATYHLQSVALFVHCRDRSFHIQKRKFTI